MKTPPEYIVVRPDTVLLLVHVTPGAARTRIVGIHDGAIKIAVTAPPEKGKANREVCRTVATALGVRAGCVRIAAGETSRSKRLAIDGIGWDEVAERLSSHL